MSLSSSAPSPDASPPTPDHGLVYPPHLLPALPVLLPRPAPHAPIRALPLPAFAALHDAHQTAHAPDHVLFPFLHGIEGDNAAQNLFFAQGAGGNVDVPRYRGLVWVICDDDLDDGDEPDLLHRDSSDDDDDDDPAHSDDSDASDSDIVYDDGSSDGSADYDRGSFDVDAMDVDPPLHQHMHRTPPFPPPSSSSSASAHRRASTASSSSSAASTTTTDSLLPSPSLSSTASSLPRMHREHPRKPRARHSGPLIAGTFRPGELLTTDMDGEPAFAPLKVPDGISLRNFGIQVPLYVTLSDIVVYSPKGASRAALALAQRFKVAIEKKWRERVARAPPGPAPLAYAVFVLAADRRELQAPAHAYLRAGHVDFARREKEEMRRLTRASELLSVGPPAAGAALERELSGSTTRARWEPTVGQVFLGNAGDMPLYRGPRARRTRSAAPPPPGLAAKGACDILDLCASSQAPDMEDDDASSAWEDVPSDDSDAAEDADANSPARGRGFDICVECHDLAPFPSAAQLRVAEAHIGALEDAWARGGGGAGVRPPPGASAVVHLPCPSSPPPTAGAVAALVALVRWLEKWLHPADGPAPDAHAGDSEAGAPGASAGAAQRRWPSLVPSFGRSSGADAAAVPPPAPPRAARSRPLKILLYSADGYTESSVPALALLMAARRLPLPDAYLALQVEKARSFFVYCGDLGVLRRVEARVGVVRGGAGAEAGAERVGGGMGMGMRGWRAKAIDQTVAVVSGHHDADTSITLASASTSSASVDLAAPSAPGGMTHRALPILHTSSSTPHVSASSSPGADPAGARSAPPLRTPPRAPAVVPSQAQAPGAGRPRASTSPWLPSLFDDHQAWFDDPRFDGSFPSRVLPFLYLGNLNHATNAYMLHALGITHVVSVGECALVPPPHLAHAAAAAAAAGAAPANGQTYALPGPGGARFVAGPGPGGAGSLWIEERAGRIRVLDIKGVCDDGIDTLEPQLAPICEWIERARREGGRVLVHCRVGVSRSATVTIAYVMQHLALPLVDAYLLVRSRRLSVLIQPNMRLLYNLCGWEVRLARARAAAGGGRGVRAELSRALAWPYLAREVHRLNEKYLR